MTVKFKELKDQALQLSPEEREILAEEILHSLDTAPLTEIDKAWIEEAEKRYQAYESGKITTVPCEKVLHNIRNEWE